MRFNVQNVSLLSSFENFPDIFGNIYFRQAETSLRSVSAWIALRSPSREYISCCTLRLGFVYA